MANIDELKLRAIVIKEEVNEGANTANRVGGLLYDIVDSMGGNPVQSDWNQGDSAQPDFIKNKPNIPEGVIVDTALSKTSINPVQNKVIAEALENAGGNPDKPYDPTAHSGLGRKTFELKEGVSNVLTQEDFSDANTIYVIRYDFTLGEDITIPANCVLEFDGGSISGEHTVTGNNTAIETGLIKIFNTDVTLTGTWNVAEAYPEWFGAKGDGVTNDYSAISKVLVLNNVSLQAKTYKCNSSLNIGSNIHIKGKGLRNTIIDFSDCSDTEAISMSRFGSRIEDLKISTSTERENQIGVKSSYATEWSNLENVVIDGFYHGLYVNECWYNSFKNVKIQHNTNTNSNGYGIILGDLNEKITRPEVNQVSFISCSIAGYKSCVVVSNISIKACTFITCAFEQCTNQAIVSNENGVFGPYGEISLIDPYFEHINTNKSNIPDGGFDAILLDSDGRDFIVNIFGGRWTNNYGSDARKWSFGNKYNLYGHINTSAGFFQTFDDNTIINLFNEKSSYPVTNGVPSLINGIQYDIVENTTHISCYLDNNVIPSTKEYCIGYISFESGYVDIVSKIMAVAHNSPSNTCYVLNNKVKVNVNSVVQHISNIQENQFKVYNSKMLEICVRFAVDTSYRKIYIYINNNTGDGCRLNSIELSLLSSSKSKFTFTKLFAETSSIDNFDNFTKDFHYYPQTKTGVNRPVLDTMFAGFQSFDVNLGKPIWWNGENWIDQDGNNPDVKQYKHLCVPLNSETIPSVKKYCIGYISYDARSFNIESRIIYASHTNYYYTNFVTKNNVCAMINSQTHIRNEQYNYVKAFDSKMTAVYVRFALDTSNKRLYIYINNNNNDGIKLGAIELSILSLEENTFTFTNVFSETSEIDNFNNFVKDVNYYNITNNTANLPSLDVTFAGYPVFVISDSKTVWWDGEKYIDADGIAITVNKSGTFAQKPAASDIYVGFRYFCTDKQTTEGATNGIEIIHKGDDVWVDALGRVVS